MEEIERKQSDVRSLKITKSPAPGSTPITKLNIDDKVIEALKLDKHMERGIRRKIARVAKVKWEVYKALEREVTRRRLNNLNINTGEPK